MEHVEYDIPDLLRDDLPEAERERILRHMAACPSCRSAWESIQILQAADRKVMPSAPEGYFATLPARILERRTRPKPKGWPMSLVAAARPLLPVVAGALVIYALIDFSATDGADARRLPVGISDAAEYLTSDPLIMTSDLAPVAEQLLTDRSLVLLDPRPRDSGLEDLEPQTTADLVEGLDDEEVDRLISKLAERTLL
jgi:hypothetical protein